LENIVVGLTSAFVISSVTSDLGIVPQCIQTQVELAEIADVKKQIISPRYANPIIILKQDTVLGSYKMTEIKRNIHWRDAMNLIMNTYNTNVYDIKKNRY
jgi:DNA-directed RNA polymerase beta' subunit